MQMKRHPGKQLILPLLLLALPLFADVKATVDNPAVYRGDPVTLTLSASGDDITFPPLSDIGGYPVQSRGTSRNIMIDNGRTTRTIEQRLVFTPDKNVTIPAIDITVDGKQEHTLPLYVKVLDPQAAPAGSPVQMQMKLSKEQVYVGEPVELDLVFKYLPGTRIDDIQISEPKLEHFWIKRINTQAERSSDTEGYITQTYRYLLFAQQSGEMNIPAIFAQLGTRVQTQRNNMFGDPFFNDPFFGGARMQYRKVYSNPATLHVQPLPEGLEVYGSFTMHSDVDKTSVSVNKPVNLHIHIEGSGNVEDIHKFDPQIDHAIVYANDPEVKSFIKDGKYYGTFDQTIAIIPDRDITITPQTFRYFDSRAKEVADLNTQPFFIKVNGASPVAETAAPVIESAQSLPKETVPAAAASATEGKFSLAESLGIFATGFIAGAAFIGLLALRRREHSPRKRTDAPMVKQIKTAGKERELFELLLPFKGEAALIDTTLDQLESNLYRGGKHTIDRKALLAYFGGQTEEAIRFV